MTAGEAVFELLTKDDQAEKSVYNMEMIDYEEELHAPMQATKYQEVKKEGVKIYIKIR